LWKEYRSYLWETDNVGKVINEPVAFNNHLMDALRYGFEGVGAPRKKSRSVVTGGDPVTGFGARRKVLKRKSIDWLE
jgi:hypothetical protein